MTQSLKNPTLSNRNRNVSKEKRGSKKRASALGSKASVTVEAALTIPIFLFAVLSLVYLLEIQSVRTSIHVAVQSATKEAAADAVLFPVVNLVKFKGDVINTAGANQLERSIIVGGSGGVNCNRTYMSPLTGEIHVTVEYAVKLPFPQFTNVTAKFQEEMTVKAWTGYTKREGTTEDTEIVYMTDHALVYHENYHCTYLQLSIRFVPYFGLSGIRNEDGGIYRRCEKCVHGEGFAGVYITNSGGKYHNSLSCSGLKRTVRAVKKTETGGRGGCSRCSK